jgi:hypothetical protein
MEEVMESVLSLIENLAHKSELDRRIAVFELGNIGGEAVPFLTQALTDPRPEVREGAALGKIGSASRIAIPPLAERPGDAVESVRVSASTALGSIGEDSLAALEEALGSPDPYVIAGAVAALGQLGGAAHRAARALLMLLDHQDSFVCSQVSITLGKVLADEPTSLVRLLETALRGAEPRVIQGLVVALRESRTKSVEAALALWDAYRMQSGRVKEEALIALRGIYPSISVREHAKSTTLTLPGKLVAAWMSRRGSLPDEGCPEGKQTSTPQASANRQLAQLR